MREGLLTAENVVEHAKHIKLEIRPELTSFKTTVSVLKQPEDDNHFILSSA